MTLERLRQPRGPRGQLEPHLSDMGISWGMYTKHIGDVTQELMNSGHVLKPELSTTNFRQAMHEILMTIQTMGPDSHLIIDSESKNILSDQEERRASKLPLMKVRRHHNLPEEYQSKHLIVLANELMDKPKFPNQISGGDWQAEHYADKRIRVYHLTDMILSEEMHRDESIDIKVYDYLFDGFTRNRYREGGNMIVSGIPSIRDPELSYDIVLERIPVFDKFANIFGLTNEQASQTFNLDTNHSCGKDIPYRVSYGRTYHEGYSLRKTPEIVICHHIMLAYQYAQDFIYKNRQGFVVADLFYKPDEELHDLFWLLYQRTLVEQVLDGKIKRKPMRFIDIERHLWNFVGARNKTYSSSSSAP